MTPTYHFFTFNFSLLDWELFFSESLDQQTDKMEWAKNINSLRPSNCAQSFIRKWGLVNHRIAAHGLAVYQAKAVNFLVHLALCCDGTRKSSMRLLLEMTSPNKLEHGSIWLWYSWGSALVQSETVVSAGHSSLWLIHALTFATCSTIGMAVQMWDNPGTEAVSRLTSH